MSNFLFLLFSGVGHLRSLQLTKPNLPSCVFNETNKTQTFFYVGFGAGLWPTGYLLQRLPVGRYVAWTVVAWGIIIALHTPAKSYAGLAVLRTALGVVESGILPSIVIILNMWFTHAEQMILVNVVRFARSYR